MYLFALLQGTDPGVWLTATEADVTIAAAIQSSDKGDCAAATKQWKGALKTIGDSLPPAYTRGQGIYESLDVVSLMSLYTPKDGVAVACTVIQCPPKSSTPGTGDSDDSNSGSNPQQPPNTAPGDSSSSGGAGDGAGGGAGGGGGEGKNKEGKELKKATAEGSPTPVTASAVTAGVGGVPPAAAATTAAAGLRGGMTVRRLEETPTHDESFNALVCLFHPKTLTKDTPPFQ